jgi:hypothetical protein
MPQPRFRQYTSLAHEQRKKGGVAPGCRRAFLLVIVVFVLLVLAAVLVGITPVRNSLKGEYSPPSNRESIAPYSQSGWFLADAHASQLASDLAWYHRIKGRPAESVSDLDTVGLRPFLFLNEKNLPVQVMDSGADIISIKDAFLLAILPNEETSGGYLVRRSAESANIFGKTWTEPTEERVSVNPQSLTSVHAQFLPNEAGFDAEYMCFLTEVWENAVASYVMLYQKPPSSLDNLLDGLGLVPNPDCMWPFDPERPLSVSCEGGLIDGKIVYWQVILPGVGTKGQARYWDSYTAYDDPDTPEKIVTATATSTVVDPGLIDGQRRVMFTPDLVRAKLESVRPPAPDPEEETVEET